MILLLFSIVILLAFSQSSLAQVNNKYKNNKYEKMKLKKAQKELKLEMKLLKKKSRIRQDTDGWKGNRLSQKRNRKHHLKQTEDYMKAKNPKWK